MTFVRYRKPAALVGVERVEWLDYEKWEFIGIRRALRCDKDTDKALLLRGIGWIPKSQLRVVDKEVNSGDEYSQRVFVNKWWLEQSNISL